MNENNDSNDLKNHPIERNEKPKIKPSKTSNESMNVKLGRNLSDPEFPVNLSFSGCGFLCTYHIGVIACLRERGQNVLSKVDRIYGASAGALIGACVIAGFSSIKLAELIMALSYILSSKKLGLFDPTLDMLKIIRSYLEDNLPQNIHILCSNKLFISLTKFPSLSPVIVSVYNSRKDLLDALICTSFIPIIFGLIPPTFNGKWYIDGGITDNLPQDRVIYKRTRSISEEMLLRKSRRYCEKQHGIQKVGKRNHTITIAPFSGEGDICPRDLGRQSSNSIEIGNMTFGVNFKNFSRIFSGFINPSVDGVIGRFIDGYNDTRQYLNTLKLGRDTDIIIKDFGSCAIRLTTYHEPSNLNSQLDTSTDAHNRYLDDINNCSHSSFYNELSELVSLEPDDVVKKFTKYIPEKNNFSYARALFNSSVDLAFWNFRNLQNLTDKTLRLTSPLIEKSLNCAIPIVQYCPGTSRLVDLLRSLRLASNELNNS